MAANPASNVAEILFNSPTGESERNPDETRLTSLLALPESYWQDPYGCGHGTFDSLQGSHPRTTLVVTRSDKLGFHLDFVDCDPSGHQHFIAFDPNCASNVMVKLQYGGEDYFVPALLFLSARDALHAIIEFCATGVRPDRAHWYRLSELDWDPSAGGWTPPPST